MPALIERYRTYARKRKTPSTLEREEYSYKHLLKAFSGNIQDSSRMAIEEYMTNRREDGAEASTVNNEFALLSNMFIKAKDWGLISFDPTKGIEKFKDINARKRFLTPEECKCLMQELAPHLNPIIRAKLYLALRTRNRLDLTWDQVDFTRDLITIPTTKNGEALVQPIIEPLKALLQELPRRGPYVFCDEEGRPYKRIIKGFQAACKRAEIKGFRPHDIRHTFGTHFIANGGDIKTLQEVLGHKTLKMPLIYVQSIQEQKRKSMQRIGEIFTVDPPNTHRPKNPPKMAAMSDSGAVS